MSGQETLSISVNEKVSTEEIFGKIKDAMKKAGIGGTLQLTNIDYGGKVLSVAWELSKATKLPVVIIVRASA
jgi:hypothetical protein